MASRGTTAHLPAYFAISLVIAAVLDVVGAFISFVAHPDDNYGAAITIVSVFIRPGMLTLLLIAVLVFAFLRGRVADDRASAEPATARRSRRTSAAVIAGWIAAVEGALFAVGAIVITLRLAETSKHYDGPDAAWLGLVCAPIRDRPLPASRRRARGERRHAAENRGGDTGCRTDKRVGGRERPPRRG